MPASIRLSPRSTLSPLSKTKLVRGRQFHTKTLSSLEIFQKLQIISTSSLNSLPRVILKPSFLKKAIFHNKRQSQLFTKSQKGLNICIKKEYFTGISKHKTFLSAKTVILTLFRYSQNFRLWIR